MVSKIIKLGKLNDYWAENCTCELKNMTTQAVFGDGNTNSEIIFIGEAPGKNEDIKGKPFIGAAGKFLNEMLNSINKKREDVYITNIVKYRPPNNRDPKPEEIEACNQWLKEEIKIIEPKLIVLLGRHSIHRFFPKEKIGSVHGKLLIKNIEINNEQAFLPLYHPAAALYNGGLRKTLLKDFKKIPKILEKIN